MDNHYLHVRFVVIEQQASIMVHHRAMDARDSFVEVFERIKLIHAGKSLRVQLLRTAVEGNNFLKSL